MDDDKVLTGIEGFDQVFGGFRVGDNVILENDVGAPVHVLLETVMKAAVDRGERVFYISFDSTLASLRSRFHRFGQEVTIVDCFTHGNGATRRDVEPTPQDGGDGPMELVVETPYFPGEFKLLMENLSQQGRGQIFIVDSLNGMAMLWGKEDKVSRFYAHMCPRLFDAGDLAVWVLHKGIQSAALHAQIGHIAQVIISLDPGDDGPTLRVDRAVGRPTKGLRKPFACDESDGEFRFKSGD
jgi:KaiC/GvpD/RAD55 family RecA-like ATPase